MNGNSPALGVEPGLVTADQAYQQRIRELDEEAGILGECGSAALAGVRENQRSTGYAEELLIFAKGMVETMVPKNLPELALLQLDSDWYESTRVALHHLHPRLVEGRVLH